MGSENIRAGNVWSTPKEEEACRVAYVAVTRARIALFISYSTLVYGKDVTDMSMFFKMSDRLDIRHHDNFADRAICQYRRGAVDAVDSARLLYNLTAVKGRFKF